jgi:hypothetical protein
MSIVVEREAIQNPSAHRDGKDKEKKKTRETYGRETRRRDLSYRTPGDLKTTRRERVSSDIANARGSIHLQLALPFAEEIFNRTKVLLIHRAMLLEFRATRAELVSRNAPIDSQRHCGLGTRQAGMKCAE